MVEIQAVDERSGWGWAALHIVKRIALAVLAYLVCVVAALVSVVIFYSVLSSLPDAPDYFSSMAMSPIIVLVVPPLALIAFYIALIFTAVQTLIVVTLTELFFLRSLWMHALFGALIAISGFAMAAPTLLDGISASDYADLGIIAASGVVGGVFYWLIAGRAAGFRQRVI